VLHIIWTCIIGLIAGAIAKMLMPGKDPGGWIVTMILGIAGSFVGTWVGRAAGFYRQNQAAGFVMSVIGALILLGAYHIYKRVMD
jgi:uncharacterized membrane protein YeaQ/YmgE (transglycosylase-associated protein family)